MQAPSYWRAFFLRIGSHSYHVRHDYSDQVRNKTKNMELSDEQSKGNGNLRMWILLGIFLILAGLFVYDHFHQAKHLLESKQTNEEQADY